MQLIRHVVVELKIGRFKCEYAGQLSFYLLTELPGATCAYLGSQLRGVASTHACAAQCCDQIPNSSTDWSRSATTCALESTKRRWEGWLGEVEGLRIRFAGAEEKLADLRQTSRRAAVNLGLPTYTEAAGRVVAPNESNNRYDG